MRTPPKAGLLLRDLKRSSVHFIRKHWNRLSGRARYILNWAGQRSREDAVDRRFKRAEGCPDGVQVLERSSAMPTAEQCRAYAADHKLLGADPANSARRSNVLKSISNSWTALAHQLENLADIEKSERN